MKNYLSACLILRYLGTRWKRSNEGKDFETDVPVVWHKDIFLNTKYKNTIK